MSKPTLNNPDLIRTKPYVNGEWFESKSTKTFKVIDPATETEIVELPDQTPEEIAFAIEKAEEAFKTFKRQMHMTELDG